jgi:hypothetical protein
MIINSLARAADGSLWKHSLQVESDGQTRALVGVPTLYEINPASPLTKRPCCKGKAVHYWIGLRWYGMPAPVRWWRMPGRKRDPLTPYDGCGCLYVLKNLWTCIPVAFK